MKSRSSVKKTRLQLLHQYYSYTGFYKFLGTSLKKALPPILLFIGALVIVNYFVININDLLIYVTENYSDYVVFGVFFASESLLGLIPPEIFIAWTDKSTSPILYLSILASLSYAGGIISYFLGKWITKIPSVHNYLEVKMAKHIKNTRKWGGFLIIVGALLPIPFSITSIAAGMIKYPFTNYLLFGLLRFLRFYLYAIAIFNLI
ncbi:YqaA family protein [Aquimarina sp. 2201CG5-10]|uniref:YqaA family protein n=1 Tax=Aquimarina callyspongiae TaxID=3098150 RepID=UPI002AB56CC1|nr:VTT domain-containing protein [Aquimarina sp. 2201CG5-10]MDY8136210.1 VTT domain-containing protein [Aquimarina sp. 2201CG5-10]